ncbi:MAG: hypothetical protein Q7S48_04765 [bacterium]|nr:hypothetical protein [bacterium]
MNRDIYLQSVLEQIPRLLTQINSNVSSITYGCGDRQYWHNTTVAFPNARYQEAVLTLCLLYLNFDTPYRDNRYILELINAGISFWLKIQEKDGSFNEWYLHEGSYVATAFSSYAISETLLLLGKERVAQYDEAIDALKRAAYWLKKRSEKRVCNQQAGALLAIFNTYLLTTDEALRTATAIYDDLVSGSQKQEGWFPEYGGADIGYLSLTIDYLAKYHFKSGSEKMRKVVLKAIDFIANFIHTDGTSGGVYGSRETEYLIPHGFELFANQDEKARFVAWHMRNTLQARQGVSLFSLDDRYLMYIAYTWLQAACDGLTEIERPQIDRRSHVYFPEAGLYVYRKGGVEIIANLKKIGAFICSSGSKKISDSGVIVRERHRNLFSGYLSEHTRTIREDANGFIVEGTLQCIKENLLTPGRSVAFFLFQMTVGRFSLIRHYIKTKLRDRMIESKSTSSLTLRRTCTILPHAVIIEDKIMGVHSFKEIIIGPKVSFIYVPSSRFHETRHILDEPYVVVTPEDLRVKDAACVVRREFPIIP